MEANSSSAAVEYEESCSEGEEEDELLVEEDHENELDGSPEYSSDRNQAARSRKRSSDGAAAAPVVQAVRRRGRGPSKRPCLNRNALMARENRQRKKEYIERIETKLQYYQNINEDLNHTIQEQNIEIKKLSDEVAYLKTVLNNSTVITSLLKAMNDSLRRMHGDQVEENKILRKTSPEILNWVFSGQTNSSPTHNTSVPLSEISSMTTTPLTTRSSNSDVHREDDAQSQESSVQQTTKWSTHELLQQQQQQQQQQQLQERQQPSPPKIARKTLPYTADFGVMKTEELSSFESVSEDDKTLVQKSSPESASHCEYTMDKNSVGLMPTTPMSMTSMDKGEASLSNTDFSHLSSFNVDLFDNFDDIVGSFQLEQDTADFLNEETLFSPIAKDQTSTGEEIVDPLDIRQLSESFNEKNIFKTNKNVGVCLHINSTRVSLEFCSICHLNSLKSQVV